MELLDLENIANKEKINIVNYKMVIIYVRDEI